MKIRPSVWCALCIGALCQAQVANASCLLTGPAAIKGTYGWAVQGYNIQPAEPNTPKPPPTYLAIAGTYTFDGKGKVSRKFDISADGNIIENLTDAGTYTVNPDCTAIAKITAPQFIETIKITILQGGAILTFINATPTVVLAGQLIRQ